MSKCITSNEHFALLRNRVEYWTYTALRNPFLLVLVCLAIALLTCSSLSAQDPATRIYGPQDQDVPMPEFRTATGQKDTAAVQQIQAFLSTTGAKSWSGMQATGILTTANDQTQPGDPFVLTLSGADKMRLDVTTTAGIRSIRILGASEQISNPDGKRHSIPFLAATAGYTAFPKLFASAFAVSGTTLFDDGVAVISGQSLHRITIEQALFSFQKQMKSSNTGVMDLYFDSGTNLLVKSAVAVPIAWSDRERYLEVTTYSNYQQADGVLVPFTMSQTIDGHPTWSMTLTGIQPLPSLTDSYFHF